jgi:hypothetical protein
VRGYGENQVVGPKRSTGCREYLPQPVPAAFDNLNPVKQQLIGVAARESRIGVREIGNPGGNDDREEGSQIKQGIGLARIGESSGLEGEPEVVVIGLSQAKFSDEFLSRLAAVAIKERKMRGEVILRRMFRGLAKGAQSRAELV